MLQKQGGDGKSRRQQGKETKRQVIVPGKIRCYRQGYGAYGSPDHHDHRCSSLDTPQMFSAKKPGPKEREISHRHPVVNAENRRIHHPAVDPFDKRHRKEGGRHHQQTAGKHQV